MDDHKAMVRSYVRKRLGQWQRETNVHLLRADLANLRRGIGKRPGALPELWGLLFRDFPEELMSRTGEPTWAEWAVSGALTIYALHQQGTGESVHAEGQRLGLAVRRLAGGDEDRLKAVQRRFNAFATARDMPECMHHLRGLVQLLRREGIPLDYVELAGDLYEFQTPEGADRVRLRWGQDFYRTVVRDEDGKDDDHA
ncbi:type I-E CRISPR-associated protein Cse2/CasB [Pseudoflavonifractor sp. MSJ-37]|uniref:type I-E CRISPR-associated protein Cse2/CasB n=1 Tax=Pseudoflavonifractor sp. MSJ-37 TaxID=2841531 RepID=UPI001C0FED01|nr:type I-E CRISPR-associated protein Cse2/CasB [Pseudoflavonifractor sp. MSJ-37]MBU5434214.1 type I-E CRISPR-associated protein Cse2/CasB [Pseudoflavonifractor sp. MSJ-37]